MPDPIQVEQLFQEVAGHIDSTQSIRHRYWLFRQFIETLEGSYKKYESYVIQLLDELPLYSNPLNWSGIDPKEIETDLSLLEDIQSSIDLSKKSANFQKIKSNLQQACLLLFCCVNHDEKVDHYLQKMTGLWFPEPVNENVLKAEYQTIDRLYDLLSEEIRAGKISTQRQKESIQELYAQLSILRKKEDWCVFVPVAEKYEKDYQESITYGRLRKMTVELYGTAGSNSSDELIWTSNIYGAEVQALKKTSGIIQASRSLFERTSSTRVNKNYYRGGIRFENTAAIHDGNSANLGIAALWYTQLLKASGHRERYFMNKNIAISGDIDVNESVKPVDKKSIGLKAKAVFFSWAKTFVIPDLQRGLFETEIKKLQKRYPDRSLAIIGVNHLREIFYDRRVAIHDVQGRIPYFLNRLKNEHSRVFLVSVIVILLVVLARLLYGPVDRNAVAIEFVDNHIALKNKSGNVIQRIESNESTRINHSLPKPNAILHDITGDGKNELIYSNRTVTVEEGDPKVRVWSISGDSLIWERRLTLNYEFPRQSAPYVSELRPLEIRVADSVDGERIVVHTGSAQYFQGVVFVYSATKGDLLSEYVHVGQIRDMMILDLNEDNDDEIVLTGVNNAFWQAFVAVLDINNAHGYSPATLDYQPLGIERATEMIYARIPKTIIGKYVEYIDKYNQGRMMSFDDTSEVLTILVAEGWRHFNRLDGYVDIILHFDRSLKPVGVGTSDIYDVISKELYEEGKIEQLPDFDYFEAYQDSILYWNGEEFLKTNEFFDLIKPRMESR